MTKKLTIIISFKSLKDLLNANIHFKLTEFAIKNLELVDFFVFFWYTHFGRYELW